MSSKNNKMAGRLEVWQKRYEDAKSHYQDELNRMDRREKLYDGDHAIVKPNGGAAEKAPHVRNITQEIIETQVDSNIPQPKVTAVYEEDEWLAKMIEDLLRNELDRLPMETINDQQERTCPIQGGDGVLPEWDMTLGTHTSVGEIKLTELHPKKIIPQHGVYQINDMDWYFVDFELSKRYIKRRYDVDVSNETEEDPEIRTAQADGAAEDLVTAHMAQYRNEKGGIGRFVWVNDTVLENLDDCQARRLKICRKCGEVGDGVKCRTCGGTSFLEETEEYEELTEDQERSDGTMIPAMSPVRDEFGAPKMRETGEAEMVQPMDSSGNLMDQMVPGGERSMGVMSVPVEVEMEPTRIPYYKPDRYPLIVRKNISKYGKFLGGSDVDAIEDQQNDMNKLSTKINEKVLGGGSFATKPAELDFEYNDKDMRVLNITDPTQLQKIGVYNLQVDITADRVLRNDIYEEARQTIGITDSMQGRKDPTATSAVAKQFSAQQAAGRLESKRTMKQAFYADLFQMMFQLILAYADEKRPVVSYNDKGEREYKTFNRWDFLKQDAAGQWYWNDQFLFSCDNSTPLASDREKLWQENRMNLQEGAYGPPNDLRSLILFWEVMEKEHYPMASIVKKNLQDQLKQQTTAQPPQNLDAQMILQGNTDTDAAGTGQAVPDAENGVTAV